MLKNRGVRHLIMRLYLTLEQVDANHVSRSRKIVILTNKRRTPDKGQQKSIAVETHLLETKYCLSSR